MGKTKKIIDIFRNIEKYFLVVIIGLMVIFSFSQIVLRMVGHAVIWFDEYMLYALMWAAMVAGGIAAYEGSHIKIDLIGRFVKGRAASAVSLVAFGFSGIVSYLFFLIFINYVIGIEFAGGYFLENTKLTTKWIFLMILPAGFFIIGFRMLNRALSFFNDLFSGKTGRIIIDISSIALSVISLIVYSVLGIDFKSVMPWYFSVLTTVLFISLLVFMVVDLLLAFRGRFKWFSYLPMVISFALASLYMLFIIVVTVNDKVLKTSVGITDSTLNLFYIVPLLTLVVFQVNLSLPKIENLIDFYPRYSEEDSIK